MISTEAKWLAQHGWRLMVGFWGFAFGLYGALYSAGFADIPAAARNVVAIQKSVEKNSTMLIDLKKRDVVVNIKEAVRVQREIQINEKLKDLKTSQEEARRDRKHILRLLNSMSRETQNP